MLTRRQRRAEQVARDRALRLARGRRQRTPRRRGDRRQGHALQLRASAPFMVFERAAALARRRLADAGAGRQAHGAAADRARLADRGAGPPPLRRAVSRSTAASACASRWSGIAALGGAAVDRLGRSARGRDAQRLSRCWRRASIRGPRRCRCSAPGRASVGARCSAVWNLWDVLRSRRRWLAKLWSVAAGASRLRPAVAGVTFHLVGFSVNY